MMRSMLPSRPAPGRSNSPRLCKHSELSDTSQQSDTTPLQAHISMVKRHPLSQAVGTPHIYHNSRCLLMSATNTWGVSRGLRLPMSSALESLNMFARSFGRIGLLLALGSRLPACTQLLQKCLHIC